MFPREIAERIEEFWGLRKGKTTGHRLITAGLSIPDSFALRSFETGRLYPIKSYNSREIVPANIVPHPETKSAEDVARHDHDRSVPQSVMNYRHWIGKFGPEGSLIVRVNRLPATFVPSLTRGDARGDEGKWGKDRVIDPHAHAEVQWLYGVPDTAPWSMELFDPKIVDQMYRAMRSIGIKSVSYEPLRESGSALAERARSAGLDIQNKDEHRIALFSRVLKRMHQRVADETGTHPLVPADDYPERRPRIGMEIRRQIRRAKMGDRIVPTVPSPSMDGWPSETWEPIPSATVERANRQHLVDWDQLMAAGNRESRGVGNLFNRLRSR